MQVLSPTFPGRILICDRCGALLAYNNSDIYGANLIYCPICKNANEIDFDKNYNGVVEDNVNNNKSDTEQTVSNI